MKRTRLIATTLALVTLLSLVAGMFTGCFLFKNPPVDDSGIRDYTQEINRVYAPTLEVSANKVEIGLEGVQKWVFVYDGEIWRFDGVYALDGKNAEKVFVGSSGRLDENGALREDGYYFTVTSTEDAEGLDKQVVGLVTDIQVTANTESEKVITLSGKGFTSTLRATPASQFVERTIQIQPEKDMPIRTGDISFVLRGKVDEYSEYGYILSRKTEDTQYSLPYSFPALAGKLTRLQDAEQVYTYINVIDYYETAEAFKTARRRVGLNDFFEEGILSSDGKLRADRANVFKESVAVRTGNHDSFYDLIYDARREYGRLYDLDVETLVTINSNMNVYDWDEAAYGATYDLLDSRGRPLGDDYSWGPYGYQNGGAESFSSMNILKGMIRYAMVTDDQELYDFAMKQVLQMVTPDPVYGKCYVMPLNQEAQYSQYHGYYFFFLNTSGSSYGAVDTYMGADAKHFGSFKYYSRVSELGEIALLTGNETLKEAYLNLMVLVKQLRLEDFSQPVEWGHDLQPKLDYENGGSSGAEAMWADCMYIAAQLTDDPEERTEYMTYMQKATDLANQQGFERSSSLRSSPKPETCGYLARMNLVLYRQTGDKAYLNYALTATQGIYFFYFHNTHPYTYFQTLGYGYACAHERWEAFMEMVESLELLVSIFEYTDDPMLYELYMSLRESALSTLPVNGYPEGVLGGHSDWLDALYVPFEQPTGVLGDNGLQDGGASSYRRWSKEQYGMGEIFLGALMYSTQGKAADPTVLVLNYTSCWLGTSRTNNAYKAYNFGAAGDKAISFNHYDDGVYSVTVDGKVIGKFTDEQLKNGIVIPMEKEKAVHIVIAPADGSANNTTVDKATSMEVTDVRSDSASVKLSADGAAYYRFYVSRTEDFSEYTSDVKFSQKNTFELGFEDSSKLYLKAVAYDKNGNPYRETVTSLTSADVVVGVQDDFTSGYVGSQDSQAGWTTDSLIYDGNISFGTDLGDFVDYPHGSDKYREPTGYMGVYKPAYAGYDVDTFSKTYTVDLSQYPLFDFYPFTKNFGSTFTLQVEIDGKTYTLLDKLESFDSPSYRFNLAELTGATGETEVTVIFRSEGTGRGFAITKLRFVKETGYSTAYDLTKLHYSGSADADNSGGMLTITNGMGGDFKNEFMLPAFDPALYTNMEVLLSGVSDQYSGYLKAILEIWDGSKLVYTKSVGNITTSAKLLFPVAEMGLSKDRTYTFKMQFKVMNTDVNTVKVTTIRLGSDRLDSTTDGFAADKGHVPVVEQQSDGTWAMVNGWGSNWAFADTTDGYIANQNANVDYGSIYKSGILIDLDATPVIRFTVSGNKGGTTWTLKANDGTMATDYTLMSSSSTGTFEVNIRDAFGRSGIINLRLDFYVIHPKQDDGSKGAFFDGYAFVSGTDLYNNPMSGNSTETVSESFTVNTDKTGYLILDIPELTYGEMWLAYLMDEDGNEYELKTVYESVYAKMYSREKEGIFKYQLTDILPAHLQGVNAKLMLKIVFSGENSQITFASIRLATDNDTLVLQRACRIR